MPERHRQLVASSNNLGATLHTVAILARHSDERDATRANELSEYEKVLLDELTAVVGSKVASRVGTLIVRRPRWTVYVVPAAHADSRHGLLEEPKLFRCLVTDLNASPPAADGSDESFLDPPAGKLLHSVGRRFEQFEALHAQLIGSSASAAARATTHRSPLRRLEELQAAVDALDAERSSGRRLSVASTAVAEVEFPFSAPGMGWPTPKGSTGQGRSREDCRR